MRVLVTGYGSIARRHIRNLSVLRPDARFTVLRKDLAEEGDDRLRFVDSLESVEPVDVAVIASPTAFHVEHGLAAMNLGADLFVEKPLGIDSSACHDLVQTAESLGRLAMVGYQFRHHAPLQRVANAIASQQLGKILSFRAEVGMYLPDWRPTKDYQDTVSASRALGGGALLELSHELDLALWFLGDVASLVASLNQSEMLDLEVEDQADLILRFSNGAVGSIHMDMCQRVPFRIARVVGELGTIHWDYIGQRASIWTNERREWVDLWGKSSRDEMYLEELKHFLGCVTERRSPTPGLQDGMRALALVNAARQSASLNEWVAI